MTKPELLAPAGNPEKLEIAFTYGADAVYIGGEAFSLRAGAGNFSIADMTAGVRLAHSLGKRLYVAANIFAHNRDFDVLPEFLEELAAMGVDGLIVSDPGVIAVARRFVPNLPLHLSTQANCTNKESALFWEDQGMERIILARELSLEEIREIRDSVSLELEAFVHGAMCVSYSGRCLLSSFLTGRSANRGDCSHPCRWEYHLVEEKRPGEFFPVIEDGRGSYILNANDMCMIRHIPALVEAGVDSFKIEGRMKSVHYVATVVKAYREAIDSWRTAENPDNWVFREEWLQELGKASHRIFSTGFFFGKPGSGSQNYENSGYIRTHDFVGRVLDYFPQGDIPQALSKDVAQDVLQETIQNAVQDHAPLPGCSWALVEQRNKIFVGDTVEVFGPEQDPFPLTVKEIRDLEGNSLPSTPHPKQQVLIPINRPVAKNFLIRKPC